MSSSTIPYLHLSPSTVSLVLPPPSSSSTSPPPSAFLTLTHPGSSPLPVLWKVRRSPAAQSLLRVHPTRLVLLPGESCEVTVTLKESSASDEAKTSSSSEKEDNKPLKVGFKCVRLPADFVRALGGSASLLARLGGGGGEGGGELDELERLWEEARPPEAEYYVAMLRVGIERRRGGSPSAAAAAGSRDDWEGVGGRAEKFRGGERLGRERSVTFSRTLVVGPSTPTSKLEEGEEQAGRGAREDGGSSDDERHDDWGRRASKSKTTSPSSSLALPPPPPSPQQQQQQVVPSSPQPDEWTARRVFELHDRDGSGRLEEAELAGALTAVEGRVVTGEEVKKLLAKISSGKEGGGEGLDFAQFECIANAAAERRRRKKKGLLGLVSFKSKGAKRAEEASVEAERDALREREAARRDPYRGGSPGGGQASDADASSARGGSSRLLASEKRQEEEQERDREGTSSTGGAQKRNEGNEERGASGATAAKPEVRTKKGTKKESRRQQHGSSYPSHDFEGDLAKDAPPADSDSSLAVRFPVSIASANAAATPPPPTTPGPVTPPLPSLDDIKATIKKRAGFFDSRDVPDHLRVEGPGAPDEREAAEEPEPEEGPASPLDQDDAPLAEASLDDATADLLSPSSSSPARSPESSEGRHAALDWTAKRVFKVFDEDESGKLDKSELANALTAIAGRLVTAEEVARLLNKFGKDACDELDYKDFECIATAAKKNKSKGGLLGLISFKSKSVKKAEKALVESERDRLREKEVERGLSPKAGEGAKSRSPVHDGELKGQETEFFSSSPKMTAAAEPAADPTTDSNEPATPAETEAAAAGESPTKSKGSAAALSFASKLLRKSKSPSKRDALANAESKVAQPPASSSPTASSAEAPPSSASLAAPSPAPSPAHKGGLFSFSKQQGKKFDAAGASSPNSDAPITPWSDGQASPSLPPSSPPSQTTPSDSTDISPLDWTVERVFALYDTDCSGTLDASELSNALTAIVGRLVTAEEANRLLKKFDADGSDELDFVEFERIATAAKKNKHKGGLLGLMSFKSSAVKKSEKEQVESERDKLRERALSVERLPAAPISPAGSGASARTAPESAPLSQKSPPARSASAPPRSKGIFSSLLRSNPSTPPQQHGAAQPDAKYRGPAAAPTLTVTIPPRSPPADPSLRNVAEEANGTEKAGGVFSLWKKKRGSPKGDEAGSAAASKAPSAAAAASLSSKTDRGRSPLKKATNALSFLGSFGVGNTAAPEPELEFPSSSSSSSDTSADEDDDGRFPTEEEDAAAAAAEEIRLARRKKILASLESESSISSPSSSFSPVAAYFTAKPAALRLKEQMQKGSSTNKYSQMLEQHKLRKMSSMSSVDLDAAGGYQRDIETVVTVSKEKSNNGAWGISISGCDEIQHSELISFIEISASENSFPLDALSSLILIDCRLSSMDFFGEIADGPSPLLLRLATLRIQQAGLQESLPFTSLRSLRELNLSFNSLSDVPRLETPSLRVLNLKGNLIRVITRIDHLALESIDLADNLIDSIVDLRELVTVEDSLRELTLTGNAVAWTPGYRQNVFEFCKHLKFLDGLTTGTSYQSQAKKRAALAAGTSGFSSDYSGVAASSPSFRVDFSKGRSFLNQFRTANADVQSFMVEIAKAKEAARIARAQETDRENVKTAIYKRQREVKKTNECVSPRGPPPLPAEVDTAKRITPLDGVGQSPDSSRRAIMTPDYRDKMEAKEAFHRLTVESAIKRHGTRSKYSPSPSRSPSPPPRGGFFLGFGGPPAALTPSGLYSSTSPPRTPSSVYSARTKHRTNDGVVVGNFESTLRQPAVAETSSHRKQLSTPEIFERTFDDDSRQAISDFKRKQGFGSRPLSSSTRKKVNSPKNVSCYERNLGGGGTIGSDSSPPETSARVDGGKFAVTAATLDPQRPTQQLLEESLVKTLAEASAAESKRLNEDHIASVLFAVGGERTVSRSFAPPSGKKLNYGSRENSTKSSRVDKAFLTPSSRSLQGYYKKSQAVEDRSHDVTSKADIVSADHVEKELAARAAVEAVVKRTVAEGSNSGGPKNSVAESIVALTVTQLRAQHLQKRQKRKAGFTPAAVARSGRAASPDTTVEQRKEAAKRQQDISQRLCNRTPKHWRDAKPIHKSCGAGATSFAVDVSAIDHASSEKKPHYVGTPTTRFAGGRPKNFDERVSQLRVARERAKAPLPTKKSMMLLGAGADHNMYVKHIGDSPIKVRGLGGQERENDRNRANRAEESQNAGGGDEGTQAMEAALKRLVDIETHIEIELRKDEVGFEASNSFMQLSEEKVMLEEFLLSFNELGADGSDETDAEERHDLSPAFEKAFAGGSGGAEGGRSTSQHQSGGKVEEEQVCVNEEDDVEGDEDDLGGGVVPDTPEDDARRDRIAGGDSRMKGKCDTPEMAFETMSLEQLALTSPSTDFGAAGK